MTAIDAFKDLADEVLLAQSKLLAAHERQATAQLIACLAEVDARRLYLGAGCRSLFTYCTEVMRLSEHAAYGRIEAGRAARRFPQILDLLSCGDITLTTVTLLAPHLTLDNHRETLQSARRKSKREVERIVAALNPRPDAPPIVRRLPQAVVITHATPIVVPPTAPPLAAPFRFPPQPPAPTSPHAGACACAPSPRPAVIAPLTPERYKIQVTVSRETHDRFRRAQDLLRHVVPDGDPATVFDRAITLLVAHLEKQKLAAAAKPRAASGAPAKGRRVPAAVRRAVWRRDDGRCAFVGTNGRCSETGQLECHHLVPFARGGAATAGNIELRCRAHNQFESERVFGSRGASMLRERQPPYGVGHDDVVPDRPITASEANA